jgi:hypothetical protein
MYEELLKTCKTSVGTTASLPMPFKKQLLSLASKAAATVLNLPEGAGREIMLSDYLDSVGLNAVSLKHTKVGLLFANCF